jgi:hypothetical protein
MNLMMLSFLKSCRDAHVVFGYFRKPPYHSDGRRASGNGSGSMGYCLEGPASCIRQISEGISLSAGISADGCLRIDAVAVPDTMTLIILGVM